MGTRARYGYPGSEPLPGFAVPAALICSNAYHFSFPHYCNPFLADLLISLSNSGAVKPESPAILFSGTSTSGMVYSHFHCIRLAPERGHENQSRLSVEFTASCDLLGGSLAEAFHLQTFRPCLYIIIIIYNYQFTLHSNCISSAASTYRLVQFSLR